MIDAEFLPTIFKLLPVIFSMLGLILAFVLYQFNFKLFYHLKISKIGLYFYNFLNKKWFFDKVYNEVIGQFFLNAAYHYTYKQIDRGLIESVGPFGLTNLVSQLATSLRILQTGFFYHYTLAMVISLICFLLYFRVAESINLSFVVFDCRLFFCFILSLFFFSKDFEKKNN
jgi:NADH-ubiquinone oxidoreductase chain 5